MASFPLPETELGPLQGPTPGLRLPVPPWTPEPEDPWTAPARPRHRVGWLDSRWRVRAVTGLLWALIALAGAGGLRGLLTPPPAPHPSPPATSPTASPPAGLTGFAELYVATWLEAGAGGEQALAAFYPGPVDLTGTAQGGHYASRTAAVAATQLAPGYWAVTVGAQVLSASPGGYVPDGIRYFRAGVESSPTGLVATALPSEVPAPLAGTPTALALPAAGAPQPGDPTAGAVQAYLAGQVPTGTVVKLTALAVSPTGPAQARAQAQVVATGPDGQTEHLDYFLRLTQHLGQWQVAGLLPAAPLDPTPPQGGRP